MELGLGDRGCNSRSTLRLCLPAYNSSIPAERRRTLAPGAKLTCHVRLLEATTAAQKTSTASNAAGACTGAKLGSWVAILKLSRHLVFATYWRRKPTIPGSTFVCLHFAEPWFILCQCQVDRRPGSGSAGPARDHQQCLCKGSSTKGTGDLWQNRAM